MDYTCHKCGQAIAEGTAFCPHCGAPQIRVSVPEQSSTTTPSNSPVLAPGTPAEMQPPAYPVNLSLSGNGIDWTLGRTSALMAGIFIGITSFLPLNLIWIPLGGFLAVRMYNKRAIRKVVRAGEGAKLGAFAGLAGYVIFVLGMIVVLHFWADKFWNLLIEAMKQRAATSGADVKQMMDIINSAEGKAFLAVFMMILVFVMMLALSALGGVIGAAFGGRADQRR